MDQDAEHSYLSCPVCQSERGRRVSLGSLCPSHELALNKIREHYNEWVGAYGSLTKGQYLQLLIKNPNSGEWVTEVARYLLDRGEVERLLC